MKRIIILNIFIILCYLMNTSINSDDLHIKSVIVEYDDILNEPTRHIDPNKPMVALTFDDGPTPAYTTLILDSLKENNAVATFYVTGSRVHIAPELLNRMILEGSEIGNHTNSHKQLTTLNQIEIMEEIDITQKEIYKVTHKYPKTLRPPYGSYNEDVIKVLHGLQIVTWDIDTRDWSNKNSEEIVNHVMRTVKNKDIILLHDLFQSSADAACLLIPKLQLAGYQLVTVSELKSFE